MTCIFAFHRLLCVYIISLLRDKLYTQSSKVDDSKTKMWLLE
jgi:hypothetical protein